MFINQYFYKPAFLNATSKNLFPLFFRPHSIPYKHISMADSCAIKNFSKSFWCKGVANASGKKVQFWVTSRKSKSA